MASSIQAQINRKGAELDYWENQLKVFQSQLAKPYPDTPAQRAFLESQIAKAQSNIVITEKVLAELEEKLSQPVASSADVARDAQTARDDRADPINPGTPPLVETFDGRITGKITAGTTNASPQPTIETGAVDAGTNAATVTLTNSQSESSPPASGALPSPPLSIGNDVLGRGGNGALPSPPQQQPPLSSSTLLDPRQLIEFNQLQSSGAVAGATPVNNGGQGGVGARSDDAAAAAAAAANRTGTVRNRLDELYGGATNAIVAQDNVLDQYASYTYSLSWYLLDPETYKALTKGKTNLSGYYLLVQSGGAPVADRSPFFPLDFYIDNFELTTIFGSTPDAGGSAQLTELSFTVTEPNGITLLRNLLNAVTELYESKNIADPGTPINYAAAQYCMVIRFYGYDINGNLVQPIARKTGGTDNRAAVEKFVPFTISGIEFKVANKLVEYMVKGIAVPDITGFSTDRGSIPQNFQFQGSTVREILVGSVIQQTASQAAGDLTRNGVPIESSPPGSNSVQDPAQRGQALLDTRG